jgi:hypothetical protein
MANPWESDSCEEIRAYYSVYSIPQAAALWCGVPAEILNDILSQATETVKGRNVYAHPKISCLEPRCRAIHDAIDSNKLLCGRDGKGRNLGSENYVAPERRTVSRQDLKEWIAKEFPSDKPEFLFDEIERSTHAAINADSFRALQADVLATRADLAREVQRREKIAKERDSLLGQRDSLQAMVERLSVDAGKSSERQERSDLHIIGALLQVIMDNKVFPSEEELRMHIAEQYQGYSGCAERTLAGRFSQSKKLLLE